MKSDFDDRIGLVVELDGVPEKVAEENRELRFVSVDARKPGLDDDADALLEKLGALYERQG